MRINPSFFFRVFLIYAVIYIGSIAILTVLLVENDRQQIESRIENNLRSQTEFLVESSRTFLLNDSDSDINDVAELVRQFSQLTAIRFTVINPQGLVLVDSHEAASQMSNHLQRPEIQNALVNGSGQISRYSRTVGEDLIYYALPVYNDGVLTGVIRSAYFIGNLNSEISASRNQLLWLAFISSLTGLLLIASGALLQAGSVEKLALIATDISQGNFKGRVPEQNALGLRKLAEVINQLARNSAANISDITADRNRLAAIFAVIIEDVIDIDQNQKILHINDAAAVLLGVNVAESTGKSVWQEVRNSEIIQALDEAIKTRSVVKTQTVLSISKSNNREDSVVDIYAASLSDDSGNPIGVVVVLHDITELKSLERIRTDFVANASHELKTPITAIRGLSESVIDDKDIDKETLMHFINRIHAQSIRLSQLVGDLMTLSRLEADDESQRFSIINVNTLLRGSLKSAEAAIEEKKHTLQSEITEETVEVYGDRQNLSQLIDNLLDNAIKYTPEGGRISVTLQTKNGELILSVSDTGIGISEQYQQRIFERFYRVDKARSKSLGGTGLGLSIVKNIAEKHDGSISIQSQPGRGSTFTYRMPLKQS